MYLARKALEPYKEFVKITPFSKGELVYTDNPPYPASSFKIRFDFELAMEKNNLEEFFSGGLLFPNIVDIMFEQVEYDLEDFIIFANTDIEIPHSNFYYPFDGVIKRKKMPVEINLLSARTYREYRTIKDCVEFTTFVRLDIKWDN